MSEFHLEKYDQKTTIQILGGIILRHKKNDQNILRHPSNGDHYNPLNTACFPCVPYFGRLYDGLTFNQNTWKNLLPTHPEASPLPIHGHGWTSEWQITDQSDSSATLTHNHDGLRPGSFPFTYTAVQTISLTPAGLKISLSIINSGTEPMPAGIGLHPYFERTIDTTLTFKASSFWFPPIEGTPGILGPIPTALGSGNEAALPTETLDHSFAGFGGHVEIAQANQKTIVRSSAPILHIYAPGGDNYFCVEPVSHLPGMLTNTKLKYGGTKLMPKGRLSVAMEILA